MPQSASQSAALVSGVGSWRRRRGRRERGFLRYCRCGEEAVIKTSGTKKNPGRLFHCCPYGSEEDKFHLFTWTDECMVEEIEDLKSIVNDTQGDISELRAQVGRLGKDVAGGNLSLADDIQSKGCCFVM